MQKFLQALLLLCAHTLLLPAQTPEPFSFKEHKRLAATPVKSQDRTGTCWCFSAVSFLESEAMRQGKGEENLSEMFVVRHIYRQKCENYVRRQGTAQLGEGGLGHDVLNAVREHGIVPESVYPGRADAKKPFDHSALVESLKKMCDEYVALGKQGKLPADWLQKLDARLDEEFGPLPGKFTVDGAVYTAQSYLVHLGINPNDYVSLTSFTHHPFWQPFVLEIPDNFSNGVFYNMPLEDLMRCLNYSLDHNYTVEWDADVSNPNFSAGKYGVALVPAVDWSAKDATQRANTFKYWEAEKPVTQTYRQQLFDSQETMDDHLMHIVGALDEAHTGLYYVVKNSWGEISEMKGFVNVSESYMRLNTISFLVNKNALPQDVRRRLDFEPGTVGMEKRTGATGNGKELPGAEAAPIKPGGLKTTPVPNPKTTTPKQERARRVEPAKE